MPLLQWIGRQLRLDAACWPHPAVEAAADFLCRVVQRDITPGLTHELGREELPPGLTHESSREDLPHVIIVPRGSFALGRRLAFVDRSRPTRFRAILRRSAKIADGGGIAKTTVIFPKSHIQHPVEIVLDGPMAANGLGQHRCVRGGIGQKVANLGVHLALTIHATDRFDRQDNTQARLLRQGRKGGGFGTDKYASAHKSVMRLVKAIDDGAEGGPALEAETVEMALQGCVGVAVIGLQDQQAARLTVENALGDRLLAAHGIERDQSVFQGQGVE